MFRNIFKKVKQSFSRQRYLFRLFDGGRVDRFTADWGATPKHTDEVISMFQKTLVARSREQCINNDYGKSFIRQCQQNIVGSSGFVLHAKNKLKNGEYATKINQAIETAWKEWSKAKNCDVTGKLDLQQIQATAVATAAKDGEFMYRVVIGSDVSSWGFALQEIDPQICPVNYEVFNIDTTNFIRHGIEFNEYSKPINYFIQNNLTNNNYNYANDYIKISANEILHGYVHELPSQKRGVPWTATALWRLRQLGEYEKSSLTNARASANQAGVLEWDEGHGPSNFNADQQETFVNSEAGTWVELPPGLRAKDHNRQYPTGEFALFHKAILRGIASGLGVSYNLLANDLESVNYSSLRSGALAEQEEFKQKQSWFKNCFLEPLFLKWLEYSLLANKIKINGRPLSIENFNDYCCIEWQARRWKWVDPQKDINAAVTAKNNLITTAGQIIREQGKDPQEVWRTLAEEFKQMEQAGISKEYINLAMGLATQGQQTSE